MAQIWGEFQVALTGVWTRAAAARLHQKVECSHSRPAAMIRPTAADAVVWAKSDFGEKKSCLGAVVAFSF